MNQREAVIHIMEENSGMATLSYLYQNIDKVDCTWKTLTRDASIRRIVQNNKFFFKIKPGLWALNSYKDKLVKEYSFDNQVYGANTEELNHSYYQGLLIELGNMNKFETYIPNQDKNRIFVNTKLSDVATLKSIPLFSHNSIVVKAKTVDVIWFNDRMMPNSFYEVEHSSNIEHSLVKFLELQDFNSNFYIVADDTKEKRYQNIVESQTYKPLLNRLKFVKYQNLVDMHEATAKLIYLKNQVV